MNEQPDNQPKLTSYKVWDRHVRIFHWLNVLCILGLIFIGLMILNSKSFGVSADGKILLKTIHVYIGYVFVVNLIWRLIWGFIGSHYAKWSSIIPVHKGAIRETTSYINELSEGKAPSYAGHNPLAKIMVSVLFVLLITQASTGLILAGTDLYLPPFGHEIAEQVTNSGEDHQALEGLVPGSKQGVDQAAYARMREWRKPIISIHVFSFYLLLIAITMHIVAVVISEFKEKNGIVSAMINGEKFIKGKPVDEPKNNKPKL
ncbi:cytochrome b/b6 domain-containing protein [Thalassotalea ponticola]|uniref:cytochrome b/b6 domain-containing protein n=1 Tax=Thalassotalea ponticola TaxID=1523392 RepID=UPI0025B5CB9B|nr:cytochrome b/b6 domain-containing protein [Thalassotalea ponticola]MDN3652262.1 cytochrome b/b6 domain-containing protein [Thalassotalea ponticola]